MGVQEIIEKSRVKETYKLTGVSHGEIDLELRWLSIMQACLATQQLALPLLCRSSSCRQQYRGCDSQSSALQLGCSEHMIPVHQCMQCCIPFVRAGACVQELKGNAAATKGHHSKGTDDETEP